MKTNHQVKNEAALVIFENKLQAVESQAKRIVSMMAWRECALGGLLLELNNHKPNPNTKP